MSEARSLPLRLCEPTGERQELVLTVDPALRVYGALVSCVMVSRGSLFPAAFAIECYRRQTYPDRELIIVSAAPDSAVERLVAGIGDPSIRFVAAAPASLGELRNISVAHARGDLICQWDDDDLSAPDRIDLLSAALAASHSMACYLHTLTLWWPARRRIATSGARAWENTMLVQREALPVYPAQDLSEDTAVGRMIGRHHRTCLLAAPEVYAYVFHGGNAWDAGHFQALFDAGAMLPDSEYDARLAIADQAMPFLRYAAEAEAAG